jgi:hypothetical protein
MGGDWSLNTDYCNAVLRAALLEGEVYVLTIERGEKKEIASWTVLFPPGCALFGTQVFCFAKFVETNQTNSSVKHNGLWDLTIISKRLSPKYKIG